MEHFLNASSNQFRSLGRLKKIVFMLLCYERLRPNLLKFNEVHGIDSGTFEISREDAWQYLINATAPFSFAERKESILTLIPDSEEVGDIAAQIAMGAGLIIFEIVSYIEDEDDGHVGNVVNYIRDAIDASIISELGVITTSQSVEDYVNNHDRVRRERLAEVADLNFLTAYSEPPWSDGDVTSFKSRASQQGSAI
jgi:uncharacterized protein YjaG (DUF416 family)